MEGSPSPQDVRKFFHAVHSLKGTAVMVPGSEQVVAPLHQLEARLTTGGSFEQLAQRYIEWRKPALDALEHAMSGLKVLHRDLVQNGVKEATKTPVAQLPEAGFCYFFGPQGEQSPDIGFYIPVESIVEIRMMATSVSDELPSVISKEGSWVRPIDVQWGGSDVAPPRGQPRTLLWVKSGNPEAQPQLLRLGAGSRLVGVLTLGEALQRQIPNWLDWVERHSEEQAA